MGSWCFIKPNTTHEDVSSPSESADKHYVEIDYSSEEARLRNQMEAVDIEQDCDFDEGDGCVLSELDEGDGCVLSELDEDDGCVLSDFDEDEGCVLSELDEGDGDGCVLSELDEDDGCVLSELDEDDGCVLSELDEDEGCVLSELDEDEVKDDGDQQDVCEVEGTQKWDEGSELEGERHEGQKYGWGGG